MKLFTAKQIQEWDKYTINHEPISSYHLMERAVQRLYDQLCINHDVTYKTVHLFCGTGNNGGDGLALARYLKKHSANVYVIYVGDITQASPDNYQNYQLLQKQNIPIYTLEQVDTLPQPDYIIDALLGTGLNRSVNSQSLLAKCIHHINQSGAYIISIDIPSGLMSEDNRQNLGVWVKCHEVYSFQQPKIVFFLKEWAKEIQSWHVVDIGLSQEYYTQTSTNYFCLNHGVFQTHFKHRTKFSHKGNYGHALLIGGLDDKTGAGILAAKAAYRSGCGLLTVMSNRRHQTAFNVAIPEAMFCSTKIFSKQTDKANYLQKFDAVGIGHGLGIKKSSLTLLESVLSHYSGPFVIDADGINLLAKNSHLWGFLEGKKVVLTPHIQEAERLLQNTYSDSLSRIEACKGFAMKKECDIVLKDAITTLIFSDGTIYFSDNGCSGMAKGGSGDILTGILTSTLAQSYAIKSAVIVSVYGHGVAAQKALQQYSNTSLTPSDIINTLFIA
ncbi:MAG: NAD(P)H-hydrate dehydratase [Bacteroidia bacterium]|nr:NAD(P)H-hydrate dehydratase [Bacteroidia bacterium]MDW8347111.1 NAD(P)H-hydrate dehydratase [Bacteroidia bacterium]